MEVFIVKYNGFLMCIDEFYFDCWIVFTNPGA